MAFTRRVIVLSAIFLAAAVIPARCAAEAGQSPEDLRDLRRRHAHDRSRVSVQPYIPDTLGRKALPSSSSPAAGATEGQPVYAAPYKVEEFMGTVPAAAGDGPPTMPRRALLASSLQCTSRGNTTFVGGGLANNTLVIRGVQSAAQCCGRCHANPNCHAWTWSPFTKFCYPKFASPAWEAREKLGMVSGQVIRVEQPPVLPSSPPARVHSPPPPKPLSPPPPKPHSPPPPQPHSPPPPKPPSPPPPKAHAPPPPAGTRPWWEGRLTAGDNELSKGFAQVVSPFKLADHKSVVTDPTGNSTAPVIKTIYEKGFWSPASGGGNLFYAWPYGKNSVIGQAVRLEYEVYFEPGFPWVKGGKLPGLTGGGTHCSGGMSAENCFSVRLMWRRDGYGEAYLYVPRAQDPIFCSTQGTVCDYNAGISLNRGAFKFESGRWMKLAITVRLNDVGKTNGLIQVDVDGSTRIHYDKLRWRNQALQVEALMFATWFGGGDASWSPPNTVESYWRNFRIYQL